MRLRDYLDKLDGCGRSTSQPSEQHAPRGVGAHAADLGAHARSSSKILLNGLTPKLKEILPLRGVRFYEMELLDRHAMELPPVAVSCSSCTRSASRPWRRSRRRRAPRARNREQGVRDLLRCHAVFSRRIASLLNEIDTVLHDLVAFVPLWLEAVEKRRALLLKRSMDEGRRGG